MEKTVILKDEYNVGGTLNCYLCEHLFDGPTVWKRPAVIVVPGGGYEFVSVREGEVIAHNFLARGFQAFVLRYLIKPDGVRYPEQLKELACAVDHVKKHAKEYNVNRNEVFVVGFSAGGHLAADLSVEWKNIKAVTGLDLDCRPSASGLCYPVISSKTGYCKSHKNLLNGYSEEESAELLKKLDLDCAVDKDTSPAFIWTTCTDQLVPSENSLLFALALARCGVPYELHVYPQGVHGGASCDMEINFGSDEFKCAARWLDDCAAFFRRYTKEKF